MQALKGAIRQAAVGDEGYGKFVGVSGGHQGGMQDARGGSDGPPRGRGGPGLIRGGGRAVFLCPFLCPFLCLYLFSSRSAVTGEQEIRELRELQHDPAWLGTGHGHVKRPTACHFLTSTDGLTMAGHS